MSRKMLIGLGALAALVVGGETCQAQLPYYFPYGGTGLPLHQVRSTFLNGRPPFFAEFPPVYYSYPIARPYGQYPFAYTPNSVQPCCSGPVEQVQPKPEPEMVYNPFVNAVAKKDRPKAKAPQPLVVLNPFVEQPAVVAEQELPKVVSVRR